MSSTYYYSNYHCCICATSCRIALLVYGEDIYFQRSGVVGYIQILPLLKQRQTFRFLQVAYVEISHLQICVLGTTNKMFTELMFVSEHLYMEFSPLYISKYPPITKTTKKVCAQILNEQIRDSDKIVTNKSSCKTKHMNLHVRIYIFN